jgi:NADH-quinone oxidoreductase subunit G
VAKVTVIFDGQPYLVSSGRNLLEAALDHGLDIPYFCWHPRLRSLGGCRQCAVKVFQGPDDTVGRIQMACMTEAREGIRASIDDPDAVRFRRAVIEWLMINHPHDCPVCDEGGECHLQDMTVLTGHVTRRYGGKKRTFESQDLGPFVSHEPSRCIHCYRCLRYYRDVAGGRDLQVLGSRNRLFFGRFASGRLESPFAGNLAEVCPTGVFTDKTYGQHYVRKWDLETVPSICPGCGLGCNTLPGARQGRIRRVQPRFHGAINQEFLCDRGRYLYEAEASPTRPRVATAGGQPLTTAAALDHAAGLLAGCRQVIGLAGGRASLEALTALRTLVGPAGLYAALPDAVHQGLAAGLAATHEGPPLASLEDVRHADGLVVIGADPTGEGPLLELAIRQAVDGARFTIADRLGIPHFNDVGVREAARGARHPLLVLGPGPLAIDALALATWRGLPAALPALTDRLLRALTATGAASSSPAETTTADEEVVLSLRQARRPVVLVSAASGAATVDAAARLARAWARTADAPCPLLVLVPAPDDLGLALLQAQPLAAALARIDAGEVDGLVLLEADLVALVGERRATELTSRLKALVVLDAHATTSLPLASIVLPAASWSEQTGTLINHEGRAQRFFQVVRPPATVQPAWRWLEELRGRTGAGTEPPATSFAELTRRAEQAVPDLRGVVAAAPGADYRQQGLKLPRQPWRATGRAALNLGPGLQEAPPPPDPETPYSWSMEGSEAPPPPALLHRIWAPGLNSYQALSRFQEEAGGSLRGDDPGVRVLDRPGKPDAAAASPNAVHAVAPATPASPATPAGGTPATPAGGTAASDHRRLLLLPRWHVFGSEPVSRQAPAIAEVVAPARLALHPAEAGRRGLAAGDLVTFALATGPLTLPVELDPQLPEGVGVFPVGWPETAGLWEPAHAVPEGEP